MIERVADYEWRGEGESAEILLYTPDSAVADWAFERSLLADQLPGVVSPIYAAASAREARSFVGWVAASQTHISPELVSAPEWNLLLVADMRVEDIGEPEEVPRLISRHLSEVALPDIGEAGVRKVVESGPLWAAEEGLLEEEDLPLFTRKTGDADTLSRRAIAAGARDWMRPGRIRALRVAETLDREGAEEIGLDPGAFALVVSGEAEDLGRLALGGHRERILTRVASGDFDAPLGLPAAPVDTEEAVDLLTTTATATNYAAGRASLLLYALQRALRDDGTLRPRAAWTIGGLEEWNGLLLHRKDLAAVGVGEAVISGSTVAVGTGGMLSSAPPFEAPEEDGRWAWEESGLLTRQAFLEPLGDLA
jgi:tRNA-splicing ligase RtcB